MVSSPLSSSISDNNFVSLREDMALDNGGLTSSISMPTVSEIGSRDVLQVIMESCSSSFLAKTLTGRYNVPKPSHSAYTVAILVFQALAARQTKIIATQDETTRFHEETIHSHEKTIHILDSRISALQDRNDILEDAEERSLLLEDRVRVLEGEMSTLRTKLDIKEKEIGSVKAEALFIMEQHEDVIEQQRNIIQKHEEVEKADKLVIGKLNTRFSHADAYIHALGDIKLETSLFHDAWSDIVDCTDLETALADCIISAAQTKSPWKSITRKIINWANVTNQPTYLIPYSNSDFFLEGEEVSQMVEALNNGIFPEFPTKSMMKKSKIIPRRDGEWDPLFSFEPEAKVVPAATTLTLSQVDKSKVESNRVVEIVPSARPNSLSSVDSASSYGSNKVALAMSPPSTPTKKDSRWASVNSGRKRPNSPPPPIAFGTTVPNVKKVAFNSPTRSSSMSPSNSLGSRVSSPTLSSLARSSPVRNGGSAKPAWRSKNVSPPPTPTRTKVVKKVVTRPTSPVQSFALRDLEINNSKTPRKPVSLTLAMGKENVDKSMSTKMSENQRKRQGLIMDERLGLGAASDSELEIEDSTSDRNGLSSVDVAIAAADVAPFLEAAPVLDAVAVHLAASGAVKADRQVFSMPVQALVNDAKSPAFKSDSNREEESQCWMPVDYLECILKEDEEDVVKEIRSSTRSLSVDPKQKIARYDSYGSCEPYNSYCAAPKKTIDHSNEKDIANHVQNSGEGDHRRGYKPKYDTYLAPPPQRYHKPSSSRNHHRKPSALQSVPPSNHGPLTSTSPSPFPVPTGPLPPLPTYHNGRKIIANAPPCPVPNFPLPAIPQKVSEPRSYATPEHYARLSPSSTPPSCYEPKASGSDASAYPTAPIPPLRISFADNNRELDLSPEKIEQNGRVCVEMEKSIEASNIQRALEKEMAENEHAENERRKHERFENDHLDIEEDEVRSERSEQPKREQVRMQRLREKHGLESVGEAAIHVPSEPVGSEGLFSSSRPTPALVKAVTWGTTTINMCEVISSSSKSSSLCASEDTQSSSASGVGPSSCSTDSPQATASLDSPITESPTKISTGKAMTMPTMSGIARRLGRAVGRQSVTEENKKDSQKKTTPATGSTSGSGSPVSAQFPNSTEILRPTAQQASHPPAKSSMPPPSHQRQPSGSGAVPPVIKPSTVPSAFRRSGASVTPVANGQQGPPPASARPSSLRPRSNSSSKPADANTSQKAKGSLFSPLPVATLVRPGSLFGPTTKTTVGSLQEPKLSMGRSILRRFSNIPGSSSKNKSTIANPPAAPSLAQSSPAPASSENSSRQSYPTPPPTEAHVRPRSGSVNRPMSSALPCPSTPTPQALTISRAQTTVMEKEGITISSSPTAKPLLARMVYARHAKKGSEDIKKGSVSGVKQPTQSAHRRGTSGSGDSPGPVNGRSGIPGPRAALPPRTTPVTQDTSKPTAPLRTVKKSGLMKPQIVRSPGTGAGSSSRVPSHNRQSSGAGASVGRERIDKGKARARV